MDDIVERLRRKAKLAPVLGGGSISHDGKFTSYISDDGMRLVNPDGPEAADRIAALVEALRVIMPIRVHHGPDYAEVYFGDGTAHSTQAMTMNPQDWIDLQSAYDAALATEEKTDGAARPCGDSGGAL